jgi:anti-sigma-K factor RskA
MNKCRFEEMAHLHCMGALSASEREEFEAHMQSCEQCREIARQSSGIREMASALGAEQPLAGLNERIMNGIKRREALGAPDLRWAFVRRWQRTLAPAALAACAVLILGLFFSRPNRPAETPVRSAAQTAAVETPGQSLLTRSLAPEDAALLADNGDAALDSHLQNLFQTN